MLLFYGTWCQRCAFLFHNSLLHNVIYPSNSEQGSFGWFHYFSTILFNHGWFEISIKSFFWKTLKYRTPAKHYRNMNVYNIITIYMDISLRISIYSLFLNVCLYPFLHHTTTEMGVIIILYIQAFRRDNQLILSWMYDPTRAVITQQSHQATAVWCKAVFIIMVVGWPAHDDVIKWRHFPRYWPFVRGIHRSPVNSPHKASDAELWCFLWSASE